MRISSRLRGLIVSCVAAAGLCAGPAGRGVASAPPQSGGSSGEVILDRDPAVVGDQSPQGCPNIPPCEQLTKFRARCRLNILGQLIVKVKLVPPDPGPGPEHNVLFGVNGQPFCTPFNNRGVAKLVLPNRVGEQVCEVLMPPNCFRPIIVDCGA